MVHNYEKTDYPEIYRNVYWGNFEYDKNEEINIIDNRNKFIKEFDIKNIVKNQRESMCNFKCLLKNSINHFFDHCETYKTEYGSYIYITSPYKIYDEDEIFGFKKLYNLYSNNSNTFYIEYRTLKDLKSKIKMPF